MDKSTKRILGDSWAAYCRHWGPLTCAYLVVFLVAQTGIAMFFMGPFYVGMCAMSLAAVRGQEVKFDALFDAFERLKAPLLAGLIVTAAAVIPPLLIFGVGILWGLSMAMAGNLGQFEAYLISVITSTLALLPVCGAVLFYTPAFFLLADGEEQCGAALKASESLVRAEWSAWTGLWVVLGLAHLASVLICCIPSFFVTPWMLVALAMRYERQRGGVTLGPEAAQSGPPAPPPTPGGH